MAVHRRRSRKRRGVSPKKVEAVLNGKVARKALEARAQKVVDYWQSIAPVFDPNDPREHRKAPAHGKPGDYRDSISFELVDGDGSLYAKVSASDFKAAWIEYGTKHMPKHAPLAKVKARFRSLKAGGD